MLLVHTQVLVYNFWVLTSIAYANTFTRHRMTSAITHMSSLPTMQPSPSIEMRPLQDSRHALRLVNNICICVCGHAGKSDAAPTSRWKKLLLATVLVGTVAAAGTCNCTFALLVHA